MKDIEIFLLALLVCIMLFDVCIASYKYKKLSLVLKAAACFLCFMFIEQVSILSLLRGYPQQNRYFLLHIGNAVEAILLLLMYREMFKKYIVEKDVYVYRKIFIVLMVLFAVFAVVNALCWQPLTIYPSYTRTALSILVMVCSALHFYKYTYEPVPRKVSELGNYVSSRVPLFWINIGLFSFYGFTEIRFAFINVLHEELSKASYTNLSMMHTIYCIIFYILIGIGFIKAKPLKGKTAIDKK